MIHKLTRLVQKSTGNRMQEMLEASGNEVDEDTAAWINANYSSQNAKLSSMPSKGPERATNVDKGPIDIRRASYLASADLSVDVALLCGLDFDVLLLNKHEIFPVVSWMFQQMNLLAEFDISSTIFMLFLHKVSQGYSNLPTYHTFYHGVDVCYTTYHILSATGSEEYMSKLELFGMLVAALAHDIGHLGVNNAFLVKTKHELALLHNDVAPLENLHASKLYEILRTPATNIMKALSDDQWLACRKQILATILGTDMALHFENMKKLEMFEEVNGFSVVDFFDKRTAPGGKDAPMPDCLQDPANRLLLQEAYLHAADLSNPVKPLKTYLKWVDLVTEEFFAQGEKEKELGMAISPMCDRATTNIPTMQLGFVDFIVAPFFSTIGKLHPATLGRFSDSIHENYLHYAKMRLAEAPEERSKLEARLRRNADILGIKPATLGLN
mmetsp:Transcript_18201/g.41622  ORF Transcript_18201/g.41622 Transcript_18201/m.41622 type:complete len:441 (+) Transcript_18201:634-1956(+)